MNSLRTLIIGLLLSCLYGTVLAQSDTIESVVADTLEVVETPPLFSEENLSIELPPFTIENVSTEIKVVNNSEHLRGIERIDIGINGESYPLIFEGNVGTCDYVIPSNTDQLRFTFPGYATSISVNPIPMWLSILPPIIAILLALLFREVITSLFLGLFSGIAIMELYSSGSIVKSIGYGFLNTIGEYIPRAINDVDHISVIVFSLLIGGMVAIISRNGGMQGIVNQISKVATTPVSGQFATWLMGVVIFFDDYANTLVVGNTMRSISDKLRISREKLSYIVDSTAAPVAALAFITTWIGAELGYIETGIQDLEGFPEGQSPYAIFLNSLQYAFYPILTLLFILMIIFTKRDFGPMLGAERRARLTGQVSANHGGNEESAKAELEALNPKEGITYRSFNAIIPIMVLIIGTLLGLLSTGYSAEVWNDSSLGTLRKVALTIGDANSYAALLWASLSALAVAGLMTIAQRIMNLEDTIETMSSGFKTMLTAIIILVLAWALADITKDLHTADFLTNLFKDNIDPIWLPALTFILGAIVSFSTGSSWGTMAILYPLMIPASWTISIESGLSPDAAYAILSNVVSCVLAGSVLGDHCSPISDTTILSSLASACYHIDHVRTQLPYALTVGLVALFVGTIPATLGLPWWGTFPLASIVLLGLVLVMGRPIPDVPQEEE